jgi:hypothetical protein
MKFLSNDCHKTSSHSQNHMRNRFHIGRPLCERYRWASRGNRTMRGYCGNREARRGHVSCCLELGQLVHWRAQAVMTAGVFAPYLRTLSCLVRMACCRGSTKPTVSLKSVKSAITEFHMLSHRVDCPKKKPPKYDAYDIYRRHFLCHETLYVN